MEFDVLSTTGGVPNGNTYICWINKLDSMYTIYLKQLSPTMGNNIVITKDSFIKTRPKIAFNKYSQGIEIVWQCYRNDNWEVYLKNYSDGQLSDSMLILSSIKTDPQITLSSFRLAWISNGNLFVKEFYPTLSSNIIFDSLNCSSPDLYKDDDFLATTIVYEKKTLSLV